MPKITIRSDRCKGCGLCVSACPRGILEIDRQTINLKGHNPARLKEPEKCVGCASCALMCPDICITVEREEAS